jgi:hypothetical protein
MIQSILLVGFGRNTLLDLCRKTLISPFKKAPKRLMFPAPKCREDHREEVGSSQLRELEQRKVTQSAALIHHANGGGTNIYSPGTTAQLLKSKVMLSVGAPNRVAFLSNINTYTRSPQPLNHRFQCFLSAPALRSEFPITRPSTGCSISRSL